ncbi:MAG: aminotransferase class V-fold PLP-dependent enzyme [Rhodobiaceae bacterium]|nr:aminotransferase class V-fold PLP-dependent enzyme [Rhodobiaceae bacterium]MCC0047595.1 aminotransferase class V-fold PLP-dependent enzyme [Rhodobiaceae bacterium]
MLGRDPSIIKEVRARFAHVETCPFAGERVFFENAGGALTLNSVVETSAKFAAIPDNQGRDNEASKALDAIIAKAREDAKTFLNAKGGQIILGESGTEMMARVISAAIMAAPEGGQVLGSTMEHPASSSPAQKWAKITGKTYAAAVHDNAAGMVTADAYSAKVTPDTRVATILHGSPVSGMGMDIAAISAAIREVAPDCYIVVDGIQHAAHGHVDVDAYGIDGYVVSPYKMFSRHGYGLAWVSERLGKHPLNNLIGGPEDRWELGTRDTGAYATFSDVIDYFVWLGERVGGSGDKRALIDAAAKAIHAHEKDLTDAIINGVGNQPGLKDMPKVSILAGEDNPAREGLVSLTVNDMDSAEVVSALRERGIRVHARKADHYSGPVLRPLGLDSCVRVSLCHYNTEAEVAAFLAAMREIATQA